MTNANIKTESFDFNQISWKSYNSIKKKAMEQKFSWSGLLISLFIAFFIVVACAQSLHLAHESILKAQARRQQINDQLYRLDNFEDNKISDKIKCFPQINLVYSAKINNAENALS